MRPLLLVALALCVPGSALAGPRRPQAEPVAKPAKTGRVSLRRLRKANPGAVLKRTRPTRAQLQRATPSSPAQPLTWPDPAKPVSKAALAGELHVPQGSLAGPQTVGFGRKAFTTASGMEVAMAALRPDAVWRPDGPLLATWTQAAMPGTWPDYHAPFGLSLTLEKVPPNRQVVIKCELTVYNGSTVHLDEYPGDRWGTEAVSMTLDTVASDAPWGEQTVHLTYVTTAMPQTAPRYVYIAADQFTFRDRNCTVAELDA